MERHVWTDSDTGLQAARWGDQGPPLVLLHGVTRRWQDWVSIIPQLAIHGRPHAITLSGHGASSRLAGPYRVIDYLPPLRRWLHRLDEPVVLIGHSLGSMLAAALAAELPDRVRGLVLEDPTFEMTGRRIAETGFPDLFRVYQMHAGSDQPVSVITRELAGALVRVPDRAELVRLGAIRDWATLRFSASCLKLLDPAVLVPAIEGRWLDGYDIPGTLNRIHAPTLLLQGDFSAGGALKDDYAAELAALIPDVLLMRLPGIGHNIHGSQPEAMLRLVLPFLASLD